MRRRFNALMLPLLLAIAFPASADLVPAEQAMVQTVDAEYERSVALLQKLVEQNSGTMNFEGVRKVAELVRPEFEQLGFKVEWKPMQAANRAGHLVATHAGKRGGKRLLLIGHLDTVFEPDSPFQGFAREGEKARGPGAADNKGGVVVMLAALRAMQAAGTLQDANIEVVLTGDEEDAGSPHSISRRDLVEAAGRADIALDFEGLSVEDGKDMGSIARRSVGDWTLVTRGKAGHSSAIFSEAMGDGAIFEMARIIHAFRTELPEPNLTFNFGLLAGGQDAALGEDGSRASATGKTNIIASSAVARGDFRTLSPEQSKRVVEKMQRIVSQNLPGTSAELKFEEAYPPMAPTAGNQALLAKLNEVNADLGLAQMPALDPLKRGAGDISFVAAQVDGLVGLGPASDGDHTPEETVDLDSMRRQAKRAAILMSRLAGTR